MADTINVDGVEKAVLEIEANKRLIAMALAEYTDDESISSYKKRILIAVGEGKIDTLNLALRLIKDNTTVDVNKIDKKIHRADGREIVWEPIYPVLPKVNSVLCKNCNKPLRRNYNNKKWEHDVPWNVQCFCGNPQSNIRYKKVKK